MSYISRINSCSYVTRHPLCLTFLVAGSAAGQASHSILVVPLLWRHQRGGVRPR